MTIVKRLRLLTAVLGTAAASAVVGTTVFGDGFTGRTSRPADTRPTARPDAPAADEFAGSKFATRPALTYKSPGGQTVFAWQVKPALPATAARQRDVLVLVDTSASQGGVPLKRARHIIDTLAATAKPGDRIDVWSVNLNTPEATKSLTQGFQPAAADAVRGAAARLVETEVAAGATDLKAGVERATASFPADAGRQRVLLYLGDGESAASQTPLTEDARSVLGGAMAAADIQFFAVPLGLRVNPHNLHGFASLTGGTVVRAVEDLTTAKGRTEFNTKLTAALDVPVLKPTAVAFGAAVAETFPAKLPPLRADRPTLVVGTLKADAAALTAKVDGTVAGVPTAVELAEPLPASESDHYFLHAMLEQWKSAPAKDAPAALAADRALALAAQQFRLFREEFLSQAVYAISADKVDHAEKLFQAARNIDPNNQEADAGLKVVAKMRTGRLTKEQMRTGLKTANARNNLNALAQDPPAAGGAKPAQPAAPPAAAPAPGATPLQQAQADRQIQEQQYRVLVDETIRRARQVLNSDPDTAYEDLKRQRDVVLANTGLGDAARARLAADLEGMMQTVATQGAAIKRRLAEERQRVADTRRRISEYERQSQIEEQTRARVDAFKQLMNQARYELAQAEAQLMIQERISRGQPEVPEATAAYMIGQMASNLREHRELVRIREDRFLLTMMQAEKSYIPYPDEPPVHFPPAAVWRELTADRDQYKFGGLGADATPSQRRIQSILDGPNAQRIKLTEAVESMELGEFITKMEADHGVQFVVLEEDFKAAGETAILSKKLGVKQKLTGLSVGTALDIALQSIGATYVVRPEYIEVTTFDKRLSEKVVRAFEVAELVFQVPSSVNQAVLQQNNQQQNNNLALFGQASFAGGFGAIGGLGLGGFGALGGALGGGGGGLGGGLGGPGGGAGLAGGGLGALGAGGGAGNLGNGGGVAGVGGGQLGQFGNLGGQFGIQGNDVSPLLVLLITEIVAKGEWSQPLGIYTQQLGQPGQNAGAQGDETTILPENQLNSLGYYPPARALIVRATGKYHPQTSVKLKKAEAAQGGPGNPLRDRVAQAPVKPGAAVGGDAPRVANQKEEPAQLAKLIDKSQPLRMWQQAMDKSNVVDPGLVVACADFLFEHDEPGHAAEVLKASIRRGVTNDVWAHDALAVALVQSKASAAEVERVKMSAVDLEPADAQGYLKAADAAKAGGHADLALAYCRRAADLEPNLPTTYLTALAYAESDKEVKADAIAWASSNLLGRDWAIDGTDIHTDTTRQLARIVEKFEKAGQPAEVERFRKLLDADKQRDLVVELLWQGGTADLDLYVAEPTGSTGSTAHRRTAGGGVLKADVLEQGSDRSEVYTAAQAFNGTYTVTVKRAFGKPVGNRATVKVTKFKGTDKEQVDLFPVDLTSPQPIVFGLEGSSRTELVDTTMERSGPMTVSQPAAVTVPAANKYQQSAMTNTPTGPVVAAPHETRLAGVSAAAPGMRAVMDLTPDRKSVRITANPVFGGAAADIPMPKVTLLPGADGK